MKRAAILVVDADRIHQAAVAGFLREAGYEVLTSADGLHGWQAYQAHQPDIVILDLLLPVMSGVELCERIARADDRSPRVPIIVMSDFTKEADWMHEPLKTGVSSHAFSKPVSRAKLLAVLAGLEKPGPSGEATPETPPPASPVRDNIVSFPGQARRPGACRMLLADDNPVTRQIVRRAFVEEHFQVDVAADGREAAGLLAGASPDIVLLDINLPGRDGFDIFDLIRRTPDLACTSVIFLKEPYEKIDEQKLESCPADGLIQKPLKSAEWVRSVKAVLENKERQPSRR